MNSKGGQSFPAAFARAFDGVARTLVGERNMKVHWVSGTAVMLVGMALPLPTGARAPLLMSVALVIATESLNAALEGVVDLATEGWAFPAKVAKDAAAGTVLVVAAASALLLADVLVHRWDIVEDNTDAVARTVLFGVPLLLSESLMLTRSRGGWAWVGFGIASVGLAVPLVGRSSDPVFSLGCGVLLGAAAWAKWHEPTLSSTSPPARLDPS